MSCQQNWVKLIWCPWTSPQQEDPNWKPQCCRLSQKKLGQEERDNDWDEKSGLKERAQSPRVWRRDKKKRREKEKHRPAKKQSHSAEHHCENRCSAKIRPFDPIPHISSVYETTFAGHPNLHHHHHHHPPLRQLFQIPGCPGEGLYTPSELWLFSGGAAISNPGQLNIPRGRSRAGKERDLHHHPPVQGRDRNKPNGTPLDTAICKWSPLKDTITRFTFFHKLQRRNLTEIRSFILLLQPALISRTGWPHTVQGPYELLEGEHFSCTLYVEVDEVNQGPEDCKMRSFHRIGLEVWSCFYVHLLSLMSVHCNTLKDIKLGGRNIFLYPHIW